MTDNHQVIFTEKYQDQLNCIYRGGHWALVSCEREGVGGLEFFETTVRVTTGTVLDDLIPGLLSECMERGIVANRIVFHRIKKNQ